MLTDEARRKDGDVADDNHGHIRNARAGEMEDLETPRLDMPPLSIVTPGQSVQRQRSSSMGNEYFTHQLAGRYGSTAERSTSLKYMHRRISSAPSVKVVSTDDGRSGKVT